MKRFIAGVVVGLAGGFLVTANAAWNASPNLQEDLKQAWRRQGVVR